MEKNRTTEPSPSAIRLTDSPRYAFFMHEWALAEAVLKAASEIAEKEKLAEVTEVNVKIGELQQVEREILRFALQQLKPAKFGNAKIHITQAKTTLKCRNCGNTWQFKKQKLDPVTAEAIHFVPEVAHTYIKCPRCGSPDFEFTAGRGIWLQNIKGTR
jgi:hydrogenase nickel incorporation protein HypA/HybF